VIEQKVRELGLHIEIGRDYEVADFDDDAMIGQAAELYYQLRRRRGLARNYAVAEMRRNSTLIGAALVRQGKADGLLCGTSGPYAAHLGYVAAPSTSTTSVVPKSALMSSISSTCS
jgi:malate dehydrogenase (oxaloacetate-decarboxylating)(NADP+)